MIKAPSIMRETFTSRSRPLLTVVIGVYNGMNALDATLDSVLSQLDDEAEIVVVDDGSTDDTARLLTARAANDQRLRVFWQENAGLTRALAKGCAAARGEYIARQDVGDLSLPSRFRRQLDFLDTHPDCAFVACGHRVRAPYGEIMDEVLWDNDGALLNSQLLAARADELLTPHHGSVMFRRDAYEQVGGYRSQFYFSQDLDLWTRLIEIGRLGVVNDELYEVAFSSESISSRHGSQQKAMRGLIAEAVSLRRRGESEASVLRRAALIRPGVGVGPVRDARVDGAYFVAGCLLARGDPAARRYLLEALRHRPWHLKAWLKLGSALVRTPNASAVHARSALVRGRSAVADMRTGAASGRKTSGGKIGHE